MSYANPPPDAHSLQVLHQFVLKESLAAAPASQVRELKSLLSDQGSGERISQLLLSLRLTKNLMDDPASQVQELNRLLPAGTSAELPSWYLRHKPAIDRFAAAFWGELPRNNNTTVTSTANAGSNAVLRDEANALIATGALDPKSPIPDSFIGTTKQEFNTEFARSFALMQSHREPPEQRMSRLYYSEKPPSSENMREVPNPSMKGFGSLMVLGAGIDLADAAIKNDARKAAAVGTGIVGGEAYMAIALGTAGAASLPVAMAIGGSVGSFFDTYLAIKNNDTKRAVKSGIEATLYGVAAWAGAAGVAGVWFPPLTVGAETVALVAGGMAVSMTATRMVPDHWDTVKNWFGKQSNDFAAILAEPSLPAPSGPKPRQLVV